MSALNVYAKILVTSNNIESTSLKLNIVRAFNVLTILEMLNCFPNENHAMITLHLENTEKSNRTNEIEQCHCGGD